MNPKTVFAISFLCLILLAGCGTDAEDSPRTISGGQYDNTAIGLSMTFPSSWQITPDYAFGNGKADILALSPPVGGFSPNVSVILGVHSGPSTMAEIIPPLKSELEKSLSDLSAYSDTIYAIDGKEVGEIQFETSVNGNLLHYRQMLFINKNRQVLLTFTDRADGFPLNQDFISIKESITIR